MLDGQEITQFTYFQQCGGMDLDPISGEITYGLERIAQFLQDLDSIYDIVWSRDPVTGKELTYGQVRLHEEQQFSAYSFDYADVPSLWKHLELYEAECLALLARAKEILVEENTDRLAVPPFPNPRRLRASPQVLAHLQPPRRPRRHLRHRARRRHGPHPQPNRRRSQNLRRAAAPNRPARTHHRLTSSSF